MNVNCSSNATLHNEKQLMMTSENKNFLGNDFES